MKLGDISLNILLSSFRDEIEKNKDKEHISTLALLGIYNALYQAATKQSQNNKNNSHTEDSISKKLLQNDADFAAKWYSFTHSEHGAQAIDINYKLYRKLMSQLTNGNEDNRKIALDIQSLTFEKLQFNKFNFNFENYVHKLYYIYCIEYALNHLEPEQQNIIQSLIKEITYEIVLH